MGAETGMPLENLKIGRVCLHEVYRLGDNGSVVAPNYGSDLLQLKGPALDAFRERVVAAFKSSSHCMEMRIRQHGPGSAVAIGDGLVGVDDRTFVTASREYADALAAAQTSRAIPGGLAVVFDGTVGHPDVKFFAVMKAELHEGFIKTANLQARFVDDLFLSPKTKLYKIGMFISDGAHPRPALQAGWTPMLYDSVMTASQRDVAATYFYSKFLGLDIPENAAQKVKQFFEKTKGFISSSPLPQSDKTDLLNGLYTYLKVDQSNTIQVSAFADTFMPPALADDYKNFMKREKFPVAAVAKDLSEVGGQLRLRRLRFPRAITLSGPPDAVKDLVTIAQIDGDGGAPWTQITIRGPIESQE